MTQKIEEICRLFAFPGTQIDQERRFDIEQKLAFEFGIKCLSSGISLLSTQNCFSENVFSILTTWIEGKPDLWTRSIGHLNRAVSSENREHVIAAIVVLAISASESGVEGSWRFESPQPIFFRVGDLVLFSIRSGRIDSKLGDFRAEFDGDGTTIHISKSNQGKVEITSKGEKNGYIHSPRIDACAQRINIVPSVLASPALLIMDSGPKSFFEDKLVNFNVKGQLTLTFRHLLSLNSEIHHWVLSVVREIIPIKSIKGSVGSSSCTWDCGAIALTVSDLESPLLLLEMLVHEASHQHFFLAKLLGNMDDGTDTREYLSPMMGMNRPIEKILLAYHAVINMLSLYCNISEQKSGTSDEFLEKRIQILLEKSNHLRPLISQTNSLTPIGKALWLSLREKESLLLSVFHISKKI